MSEPKSTRSSPARKLLKALGVLVLLGVAGAFLLNKALNRAFPPSATRMALILSKIAHDQETFRAGDQEGDGRHDYATLEELVDAQLLIPAYRDGESMGYRFEVQVSASEPTARWMAVANLVSLSGSNEPNFVINHEGVLYAVEGPVALNPECEIPEGATPYED